MNKSLPIPIKKISDVHDEEHENLSFSVFAEKPRRYRADTNIIGNTPPEQDFIQTNLNKIYPKETKKWVNSDLILQCQDCHINFSILVRKHHCRACGCVFCSKCCNNYVKIPKEFIHIPSEDNSYIQFVTNTKRWLLKLDSDFVCNECYAKINNINNIVSVIKNNIKIGIIPIVKICEFLDLESLFKVSLISKGWYNASIHYLSKFRTIQYNNPYNLYSEWEINMIYISKEYYSGHSSLILSLIKSSLQKYYMTQNQNNNILNNIINHLDIFSNKQIKNHLDMMCSRRCNTMLDIVDFVEILKFVLILEKYKKLFWIDIELKKFIIFITSKLNEKSLEIIQFLVPILCNLLINLMSYENIDLEFLKTLMKYITNNNNIFYFLSELNYLEELEIKTKEMINFIDYMKKFMLDIIDSKIIEQSIYLKESIKKMLNNEKIKLPILYPLDFRYNVEKINTVKIIQSHTSPYIIDADIIPNIKEKELKDKKVKFIIKNAVELRKEKIISCLIKLLQYKLKEQMLLGRISKFDSIPSYNINIITKSVGIIEFVENSLTLREISEKKITLQNYILNNNKHQSIDSIKKRFVHSLAISSIISYMLGLGDRHLDNIMINNTGQIFHIDYGYIMNNPANNLLGAPNIKVTKDMIDFLGGESSYYYDLFTKFVIKVYDILRLYKNIIIHHYEMMGMEELIDWNSMKEKIEMRFMEGMTSKDVGITLINEIETSNSFVSKINDIGHTTSLFINNSFLSGFIFK
jgi:hypothetical protein